MGGCMRGDGPRGANVRQMRGSWVVCAGRGSEASAMPAMDFQCVRGQWAEGQNGPQVLFILGGVIPGA